MTSKLISQGAEAKIFLMNGKIVKSRVAKKYRHPELDLRIRKRRTKSEVKILQRAFGLGLNVPKLINSSINSEIHMKYIDGDRLSETLNFYNKKKQLEVMKKLGEQVSKLHENDIIHGDLTTSNIILKDDAIYIIDFGLGFISKKIEDMAVDLHLIRQALEAKHFENFSELFDNFLNGYNWTYSKKVVERLDVVERRGRYKRAK